MKSRRRVNSTVIPSPLLKTWQTGCSFGVSSKWPISRATSNVVAGNQLVWSRALHCDAWSARPTWARYNKSLDASGGGVLGIYIVSAKEVLMRAAASTQPEGGAWLFAM